MARVLLLLVSEHGVELERLLGERMAACFDSPQVTAQLLRAIPNDPFYDPGSPHARPQLVVDLRCAPGKPLGEMTGPLGDLLSGTPVATSSRVLAMHERVFIDAPPQRFHYHYLMLRHADFSAADYYDYYVNYHCRMGFNTPAIAGYTQNYVDPAGSEELASALGLSTREVTSISELTMASHAEFIAHPDLALVGSPAAEDEARFVDRENSVSFCSEVVLRVGDFQRVREALFEQHFPAPG